jgi:CRP-like cAMP-binding protein
MYALTYSLLDRKINSFTPLSAESKALLFEYIRPVQLLKGEILLQEGNICRSIYFVDKGLIRSFKDKDEKETNLEFSPEGSFVTHLRSLRTGSRADYGLQAIEPTWIWEFPKAELLDCYSRSREIESFGRQLLERLMMQQREHTLLFKALTPAERYQYIADHHPTLFQRVSLTQLSSYLGIARETVSPIGGK